MKLLNLWPQAEVVVNPRKRLILEIIMAALWVVVAILLLSLWYNWRLLNANDTEQKLQTELTGLQKSRVVEVSSGAEMPRVMRQLLVGQLDWMGELPQWMVNDQVRWVSAKFDETGLKLEGIATSGSAINEMVARAQTRYSDPPIQVSEIANISLAGQNLWRFQMSVNLQTLQNKVELTAGADQSSADSTTEMSPVQKNDSKAALNQGKP